MTLHHVRRIATAAGAAAIVTAFAAGCGAAAVTADPASATPETASTTPQAPSEVTLAPSTQTGGSQPTTVTQEAPGPAGPTVLDTAGQAAVPPIVETPAPPTGGGKGGH
jgi:hypothetical protein